MEDLQQQVQEQALQIADHEQFGLQRIQHIHPDLEDAGQFQLLLVIQPVAQGRSQQGDGLFSKAISISTPGILEGQANTMGIYNSYAMLIISQLEESGLSLKINFDSGAIHKEQVQRIAPQLEHLLPQLCSEECRNSRLRDITFTSEHDLASIWEWNKTVPEPVLKPVDELIDGNAAALPEALAICAWDKNLTYRQLKDLSLCLAYRLHAKGIGVGCIVLLSFEKSAWMMVLMIAVLKTGATALPLSAIASTHGAQELVETLRPKIAITSVIPKSSPFHGLMPILHVSELVQFSDATSEHIKLHKNGLEDPAVILFTSGSTGAAKGILWSHATLSTNIHALNVSFALTASSRVFQFADYEFDVSNIETFATLSAGGCLCIPTESDRSNRLAGAINDAGANWMCLTPSVAEALAPKDVPSLKTLVCAGEMLQQKTAFKWMKSIEFLYNWYGPAEAAVATSYFVEEHTWKPGFIGSGSFAVRWLVDPKDHNSLTPVGAISELCIEGPILAAGYVGGSGQALNERSFIYPPWLQRGQHKTPGRKGKIYKTGDLVKYDAHGRLIIIGRSKDSQRKLHGQRVELAEIERQVQAFLSGTLESTVVAEIFSPANSNNETLALFVSPADITENSKEDIERLIKRVLPVDELEASLLKPLPTYLIPKLYIPIPSIPLNHAGKTDRRRLRRIGGALTHAQLAKMQPSHREARKPGTEMEKRLQQLWAEIIGVEADAIYSDDNFLRFGGDSIGAMRLVASARDQGLSLTVAHIFEFPRLSQMAGVVRQDGILPVEDVAPFSLLNPAVSQSEVQSYAARLCQVPASRVVDMYPCTALQEGLLAMTARRPGQYVSRSVLELQIGIENDMVERAWRATVEKFPILRT